jgi:hypothetical protein
MSDFVMTRKEARRRRNRRVSVLSFASFILGTIAIAHPGVPHALAFSVILAILSLLSGICGSSQSRQFQAFAAIGILFSLIYLFAVFVTVIGR